MIPLQCLTLANLIACLPSLLHFSYQTIITTIQTASTDYKLFWFYTRICSCLFQPRVDKLPSRFLELIILHKPVKHCLPPQSCLFSSQESQALFPFSQVMCCSGLSGLLCISSYQTYTHTHTYHTHIYIGLGVGGHRFNLQRD